MPQRRNFWLYKYDQVKYRTPLQWSALLIVSVVFAGFGSVATWAAVIQYRSKNSVDVALIATAAAFLAAAVIELPAAAIFFFRRWRGEIVGYFDYEVIEDEKSDGVHNGPDHR